MFIHIPSALNKKHGTGIGLALTKKIILDRKGFIKVESHLDKGTTFNVYIPFVVDS
ncbi:MAG: ATP-binding protein [Nitrospirota bacterium]